MVNTILKYFLCLSAIFFITIDSQAQTILPEYGDVSISPDNFVTGVARRCAMDVQKSTGKQVYVYAEKEANPSTSKDLWCVIYNADMTVLVNPFRVNNTTTGDQLAPAVVVHQNDNAFYVTWYGNQSGNNNIYAKKISLDVTNATSSAVMAVADVTVNDIATGEQVIPLITINYAFSEVIIAFKDLSGNDGGGAGTQASYARRFTTTLSTIGTQFLLHTPTTGSQVLFALEMKNEYLIAAYSSNHVPANSYDLFVSVFTFSDPPGAPPVTYSLTSEFRVNNYLTGDQNNGHIAINGTNNDFVVTWSSQQDGSSWGVYSKIYSSTGASVIKDEFLVNSVTADNQLLGRAVWEESNKQLMYFYHHSLLGFSTLKYRLFDGLTTAGQYNPVDVDQDLIGGLDTRNYYYEFFNLVYNSYTNRLNLVYDIFDTHTTYNTKAKARSYIFKHPNLVTPAFINNTDLNRNWIHSRSYAEDGSLIAETRQYYDSLGNPTQSQARNVAENGTILASANIYDAYNRPVLQTLAAPITEKAFTFKNNFITPSGSSNLYQYNDFDKPVTVSNVSGEVNNPKPVDANSLLGKYYSDNNTYEAMVGTTSFPYSRIHYNDQVYGGVVKGSSPGEALKMGTGHEVKGISLPVLNELDHYLQLKKLHFGASAIPATSLAFRAMKSVKVDQNGIESISFEDMEGKIIATAKANGNTTSVQGDLTYNASIYNVNASAYLTVSEIKISASSDRIEIRALYDNALLYSGYEIDLNLLSFLVNSSFQVRSKAPFKLSYKTTNNHGAVNYYSNLASTEFSEGHESLDFYLKNPSSLALSLGTAVSLPSGSVLKIKILNLQTGSTLYSGDYAAFNNSILPVGVGFYRIQLDSVPVLEDYNTLDKYLRVSFDFPYSDWSYYFYDRKGNMVGNVAPKGVNPSSTVLPKFKSDFTYSSTGQLLSVKDPDRGVSKYVYRKDGSLRFSQDAKQATSGKFSYTNFDVYGRTVESGEYDPALVSSNAKVFIDHRAQDTAVSPNPNSVHTLLDTISTGGGLQSTGRTQVNYILYTYAATDAPRTQTYVRGKASATFKKNKDSDGSYVCKTWYSYDERGRTAWVDQTLTGLGTKTTDYTYVRELLTNVVYQKNTTAERFEHKYSYDAMLRMKKVETAVGAALLQTDAQYFYYLHGPLKRKELGNNLQGIDYVYTVQGWLKGINHPELTSAKDPGHDGAVGSSFSQDVFGMSFDYYQNDYVRTNSNISSTSEASLTGTFAAYYNGNIRAITWQTTGQGISGNPCQYAYTYDYKYQLLSAVFGSNNTTTKNFTADGTGKFGSTATYDANGNLLTMFTNKGIIANDNYEYKSGVPATTEYTNPSTNKLIYLANSVTASDTRTYQYDEIGQLINETKVSGAQKRITYDVYGKVIEVRADTSTLKVQFVYNERGQRIKKITYSAGVISFITWYVLDVAGNVLSIYDTKSGSLAQTEIPIFGASREGVVQKTGTAVYTYEIKDHLGNVRATVKGVSGVAVRISWMDYLPFGEVNPDRQSYGTYASRHQYQGDYTEHDPETDWESFELRMYDARIGRWMSPDPYAVHWSPYLAMNNNPVKFVDPDGGDEGGDAHSNAGQYYTGPQYYYGGSCFTMDAKAYGAVQELAGNIVSTFANNLAGEYDAESNSFGNPFGITIYGKRGSGNGISVPYTPTGGFTMLSSFHSNADLSAGTGRNILTAMSITTEASLLRAEEITRRAGGSAKGLKSFGGVMAVIGIGFALWEGDEKGWTKGAATMFTLDLVFVGVGFISPVASLIYGVTRLTLDVSGIDAANEIDNTIHMYENYNTIFGD